MLTRLLFAGAVWTFIVLIYCRTIKDNGQGSHATICRMTNDSSKNKQFIKTGMLTEPNKFSYQYDLIWCDEDYANKLIEEVKSSNDTKKVVFLIGGSTKRERKQHWINNFKMHIKAEHKVNIFTDALYHLQLTEVDKARFEKDFQAAYPKYHFKSYVAEEIHERFEDIFDPNWKIVSDPVEIREYLGLTFESFDPKMMVLVRNQQTEQEVVLIGDIHSSKQMGDVQRKLIQKWNPDGAVLELDLYLWKMFVEVQTIDTSVHCPKAMLLDKGCKSLMAVCGLLGCQTDGQYRRAAVAMGLCGLMVSNCLKTKIKSFDHAFKGRNMMTVLESGIPDTIYFAEWFYANNHPGAAAVHILMGMLKDLNDSWMNDGKLTRKLFEQVCGLGNQLILDLVNLQSVFIHKWREFDENIMSEVRSDIMFQSLMKLSNMEKEGGNKHKRIVGVFGLSHVCDLLKRFSGEADGFLLTLKD